ncbi:MAG: AMP-binding protein [Bacteroidota bacterium]
MRTFLSFPAIERLFTSRLLEIAPRLIPTMPNRQLKGDLQDDIGLDSIEIMELAAYFHGKFHMMELGTDVYLLSSRRVEDWLIRIHQAANDFHLPITFFTSGSTGEPKACQHDKKWLLQECESWGDILQNTNKLWGSVSPRHIYGFIFTLLLPDQLDCTIEGVPKENLIRFIKEAAKGDVFIGFPDLYQFLGNSFKTLPAGITAISSTAKLPFLTGKRLSAHGMEVMEIYGSSETGGIGYRMFPENAYTLLPFWKKKAHQLQRRSTHHNEKLIDLPDNLSWLGDGQFQLSTRKDHAVQVGGNNVFPLQIQNKISSIPGVKNCWVRKMNPQQGSRLKCWIQTDISSKEWKKLETISYSWIESHLTPPERPKHIQVASHAPLNEMGKVQDWPLIE